MPRFVTKPNPPAGTASRLGRMAACRRPTLAVILVLIAAVVAMPAVWSALPAVAAPEPQALVAAYAGAAFAARPGRDDRRDDGGDIESDRTTGRGSRRLEGDRDRVGAASVRRDLASRSVEEVCGELGGEIVNGLPLCSHGPDPAPTGFDPARDVSPLRAVQQVPTVACIGDGVSGSRVEVLYVYPSDAAGGNRYDQYLGSIRTWVADVDKIFRDSAAITGGKRQVRIVTDGACRPVVTPVGVPARELTTFGASVQAVSALGFKRPDRNYLMFVDAKFICGQGSVRGDDRPGQENMNNTGGSYARVDSGCWNGFTAAHEVMHNLGGVQQSAPNDSGGWHCTDERDIMCYSDSPFNPPMRNVCTSDIWMTRNLFDCGQDDYFSANPAPGSYLTRKWNTANSRFLVIPPSLPTPAPDPTVKLSDDQGAVGQRVTVQVAGFPNGDLLSLSFDGTIAGYAAVGKEGAARLTLTVPASEAGAYEVAVVAGNLDAATTFEIVPTVRATRPGGRGPIIVNLSGFAAGEQIDVGLGAGSLTAVAADANGSAATEFAVANGARGKRVVTAIGAEGNQARDTLSLGKKPPKGKGKREARDKGRGGRPRGGAGGGGEERPVLAPVDADDERRAGTEQPDDRRGGGRDAAGEDR